MFEARRAVARGLLKAAAAFGPIQLTGEERAYFRDLLTEPEETMPGNEVERRLTRVTSPVPPRVIRVSGIANTSRNHPGTRLVPVMVRADEEVAVG